MTTTAAAEQLGISPETVRTHVRNAMNKLGARTRAQAIAVAMRDGEIPGLAVSASAAAANLRIPRPRGLRRTQYAFTPASLD